MKNFLKFHKYILMNISFSKKIVNFVLLLDL